MKRNWKETEERRIPFTSHPVTCSTLHCKVLWMPNVYQASESTWIFMG